MTKKTLVKKDLPCEGGWHAATWQEIEDAARPGYQVQRGPAQQDRQRVCAETRRMGLLDQEWTKGEVARPRHPAILRVE